jgi:tRNA (adenine22-N1)-methyltransferase
MRALCLDARLRAVAQMVPRCACAADIGADHGFLGAHLLLTGRCVRVRFIDISEDSLRKARRLIARLKLEDRAEFLVGDGAQALGAPVDAAVIAGLGAQTICGILHRGRSALDGARLILAPNSDAPFLRRFLMESGYRIMDEALVCEGRRFYPVILAEAGAVRYTQLELLAGPVLLKKRPGSLAAYAKHRSRVVEKALRGAQIGAEVWAEDMRRELLLWEEVRHGYGGEDAAMDR